MNKNRKILSVIILIVIIITICFYISYLIKKNQKQIPIVIDKPWEGKWILENATEDYYGLLTIKNQTATSFTFAINTFSGANIGSLNNDAKITNNTATSIVKNDIDNKSKCQIVFTKKENLIEVRTDNEDCKYFRGEKAFFGGNYLKNPKIEKRELQDIVRVMGGSGPNESDPHIFKNDSEISDFEKLIGPDYIPLFTQSFQMVFRENDTEHLNARIYTGSITSTANSQQEGIIAIGLHNRLWAAVTDGDNIRYFTSVPDYVGKLPKTFEYWSSRFQNKKIIYMDKK